MNILGWNMIHPLLVWCAPFAKYMVTTSASERRMGEKTYKQLGEGENFAFTTSDWHRAAVETKVLSQSTEQCGDVMEQLAASTAEKKKQNRDIMKKLIRS